MKTVAVLIMGLWAASWAEAQEPVETAHQQLPLAVGNSWRYTHTYFNYLTEDYNYGDATVRDVTIRITHTEDIEGHTYYVFSPMPYEDPPVLSLFPAGQKVRFDGYDLVSRGREGDIALYQFKFGVGGEYSYSIPETESDTLVVVVRGCFRFQGHKESTHHLASTPEGYPTDASYYYESRQVNFIRGLGLSGFIVDGIYIIGRSSNDVNDVANHLVLYSATINGVELDPKTFRYTAIRETSWGALKRAFFPFIRGGSK